MDGWMDGWMDVDVNIDIPVLKHSSSEYNQCVSLLSQTDRKSVGFLRHIITVRYTCTWEGYLVGVELK